MAAQVLDASRWWEAGPKSPPSSRPAPTVSGGKEDGASKSAVR